MNGKKRQQELESRVMELEEIVEKCSKAFELIPIWALERGHDWHPSDDCIRLLKKAKDGVTEYIQSRYHGERRN